MDFSRFQTSAAAANKTFDVGLKNYMLQVYNYMFIGLALTGLTAFAASQSIGLMQAIYATPLKWVVMFAPLIFVFVFASKMMSMSLSTATKVFWGFSVVMGLSMSYIFLAFTGTSIAKTFFITATMFGGLSLVGYTTKKDLTAMGSFLIMGVWGILALMIVNLFVGSAGLSNVISLAAIAIFAGLTAYDTQKIKNIYLRMGNSETAKKLGLMGALSLYLDFINIFIHLLQFIGERR